jgi:transcriptional regulator with XRE-family HTH domain
MSDKNRIEKVMLHYDMTSSQFAAEIGIQSSTLSHILNNRNNPSLDVLKKILSRFTEISSDWLILGQGSMLRQEKHSKEPTLFDSIEETSSLSGLYVEKEQSPVAQGKSTIHTELLKDEQPPTVPIQSVVVNNNDRAHQTCHHDSQPTSPSGGISDRTSNAEPGYVQLNPGRKVTKVILYFTDNTFQEFESK